MNISALNLKNLRDGVIALITKTQKQVTQAFVQCAPSVTASVVQVLEHDSQRLLDDLETQRKRDLANRCGPNASHLREMERIEHAYAAAKATDTTWIVRAEADAYITALTPKIYGTYNARTLSEALADYVSFVSPFMINVWNHPIPVSSHEDIRITHEFGVLKIKYRDKQKSGCWADTTLELRSEGFQIRECQMFDVLEDEHYNGGGENFDQEGFLKLFLESVPKPTAPSPINLKEEIDAILRADPLPASFTVVNQKAQATNDGLKQDRFHYWETDIEGVPHWTCVVHLGRDRDAIRFNGIKGFVHQWFFIEKYRQHQEQTVLRPCSQAAFLQLFKEKRKIFMDAARNEFPEIFENENRAAL